MSFYNFKNKNHFSGSNVLVSNHSGNFVPTNLASVDKLILIAAGSGFTPMAKVIQYFQYLTTKNPGKGNAHKKEVVLLFFNKTQKDIIWRDQLDRLQKEVGNISILICHILSQEPEWSGHQGKVSTDLLTELISDKTNKDSKSEGPEKVCRLVCVCGPNPFTETTQRWEA